MQRKFRVSILIFLDSYPIFYYLLLLINTVLMHIRIKYKMSFIDLLETRFSNNFQEIVISIFTIERNMEKFKNLIF